MCVFTRRVPGDGADPKIYSMGDPLRQACFPACGRHTPATVNIVRSLLQVDPAAALLPSNDGRLAIHMCCDVEEHSAATVEVLHMLIGANRDGVSYRKGNSDKGRLPFHYCVVRMNHNEVRGVSGAGRVTTTRCSPSCLSSKVGANAGRVLRNVSCRVDGAVHDEHGQGAVEGAPEGRSNW